MSFDGPTVLWIALVHTALPYEERAAFIGELERLGAESPLLEDWARCIRVNRHTLCGKCDQTPCVCEHIGGRE